MKSKRIIITTLPNIPWLYLPIYFWAEEIILPDTSLMDGFDRENSIKNFCKKLSWFGLDKKIKHHGRLEHDKLFWKTNILAANITKRKVNNISTKKNITYYFANYLFHRRLRIFSTKLFIRELAKSLKSNDNVIIFQDGDYFIPKYVVPAFEWIFGVAYILFLPLILLMLNLRVVLKKTKLVFHKTKKLKGGVAVDLMVGVTLDNNAINRFGILSDSFFVNGDKKFSMAQHHFLDYGWPIQNFKLISDNITKSGASVFGIRSSSPDIEFKVMMSLIFKNFLFFFRLINKNSFSLKISNQLMLTKFLVNIFEVQICFSQVKPSVYFSRLDYSYLHHPLAAVCNDLGIHFSGICHSPLGDSGHINHISLISFDTYFIYHPIFADVFFPTWRNGISQLIPVGVWRSDFIIQSRKFNLSLESIDIRQHMNNRFIVALHLPVPQSYWFDKTSVLKWMDSYTKLIEKNKDVAFIIFPRRLEEAPDYFIKYLDDMLIPGRCEIAYNLKPELTQSYSWYRDLDMVIGCNYSDVVLEALACKIPAISYANIGAGVTKVEEFDNHLSVHDFDRLEAVFLKVKKGVWPSVKQWKNIDSNLVGKADGNCISRIRSNLSPFIKPVEVIRS